MRMKTVMNQSHDGWLLKMIRRTDPVIIFVSNSTLLATVYALGRVNMILTDRNKGTVKIVNDEATDYDWNVGGGSKRNTFIHINNTMFGINPQIHGFKTFYYGVGTLRK